MRKFGRLLTAALAVGLIAGCAPAPIVDGTSTPTPTHTDSTPPPPPPPSPPSPTPEPSPTEESSTPAPPPEPTETATAAPDPRGLMPGTNHNHPAAEYAYPAADVHDWIIRRADPAEKLVFLTFDDGPSELTGEMLDVLAAHEVPATFFVVGRQAGDRAATLHRQIREGHAIGLHSYSHDYDRLYPDRSADPERIREEIRDSKAAIAEVFGDDFRTGAWRHPGGRGSWDNMAAADEVLAEEDLTGVDWNALTGDSEPRSTRPESTSEMVSRATLPISWDAPAVVILAHDTRNARLTLESMPEIISAYRDAGYRFAVIA